VTRSATACRGLWYMCVCAHHWAVHSDGMSLQAGTQSIHFLQKFTKKLTLIAFKNVAPRGPRDAERHCLPRSLVHVCVC
jgi:hypothetical protein